MHKPWECNGMHFSSFCQLASLIASYLSLICFSSLEGHNVTERPEEQKESEENGTDRKNDKNDGNDTENDDETGNGNDNGTETQENGKQNS